MHCENATIFCWAPALLSLSGEDEPPLPGSALLDVLECEMRDAGTRGGATAAGSQRGGGEHGQAEDGSRHISISFTFG